MTSFPVNKKRDSEVVHDRCIGLVTGSPAGLSRVKLMASAVVVLTHETSTLRQRHNIDLKLGVDDYVREVTSPAKFGMDLMSSQDATWGQHIRVL